MTEWCVDGPDTATTTVILAHGAGAGMASPFMAAMATGLAGHGLRVVRFEFEYMAIARATGRRRPPAGEAVLRREWQEIVAAVREHRRGRVVIGGKSLGGRMASLVADELAVDGLLCLGYPFHPPGRGDRLRIAHLAGIATPTLILQGERDAFGNRQEVMDYPMSPRLRVAWLPDGDHSFRPRKRSGRTEAENLAQAAAEAAAFAAAG